MKFSARFLAAALALLSGFTLTARAQVFTYWTGDSLFDVTDFNDNGNWDNFAPDDTGTITQIAGINNDTVNIGGAATAYVVFVGNEGGNATLNIGSGKSLTAQLLSFGTEEGSTGFGNIAGTVTTTSGITVGDGDYFGGALSTGVTGSLSITAGGTVNGGITVANAALATGTVTVTGTGSTVNGGINGGAGIITLDVTDSAIVNDGISSSSGSATINITNSATVNGVLSLGGGGINTLDVDGGTLQGNLTLAADTGGNSSALIQGGTHEISVITLGGNGTNTLNVQGGATIYENGGGWFSTIGNGAGTNNTMTLNASAWNAGSSAGLEIGRNGGTGTFTMEAAATANFGTVNVGLGSGSSNGTLNVTAGSVLTTHNAGGIGLTSGSTGTVSVSGTGSQWNITNGLEVGSAGTGSLAISAGGAVTAGTTSIGGQSGSSGSISVSGAGSSYTSGGTVTMGNGTTALTLANGGTFTITEGNLLLGNNPSGSAALNIGAAANQAAAAPGYLVFTTVDTNPGTLAAGHIRSGFGTGTVVFNHTSSNYTFGAVMDFGVNILQKAGTTTLTGGTDIHGLSGDTNVTGGTLRLGINQAIGTGNLTLGGGTLDLNGFSQTNTGILDLTGNTYLDFSGVSTLALGNSSAETWSGILTVLNFDGSDSFRVGTDVFGLTGTQLGLINIGGFYAQIDASGYLSASSTVFTAIPEPSTYAILAGVAALGLAVWRRRLAIATARQF